jgi:hypothetical protein
MTSRQQQRLADGADGLLEPGERVVASLVAQAAGAGQSRTARGAIGGVVGTLVADAMHKPTEAAHQAAAEEGIVLRSPMGVVLTDRRILTLQIDGLGKGNVKELLSALPIDAVDSIECKAVGLLGSRVMLTIRGSVVNLECNSRSEAKEFAASFGSTKSR